VVFAAGAWLGVGRWTLTLDRQKGTARLRRPWRTRRALAAIVGVRLFSLRQAQIERVRRRRNISRFLATATRDKMSPDNMDCMLQPSRSRAKLRSAHELRSCR